MKYQAKFFHHYTFSSVNSQQPNKYKNIFHYGQVSENKLIGSKKHVKKTRLESKETEIFKNYKNRQRRFIQNH
jgi:hypothetical protein